MKGALGIIKGQMYDYVARAGQPTAHSHHQLFPAVS